jgi:predicted Zn-dependent peptidase
MEHKTYEQLGENLFMERLPNGLTVYVVPKPGFQKTYATFSTQFGSVDNHFKVNQREAVQVPDGIAHFLEHKMFEEPEGDIFAEFANQGASSNAFTAFDRTVYLFSATESIDENLDTLLDFVQHPYFTDDNVEKEKGIIGQEIKMYEDNADWRSYFGLIEAMYVQHPVKIDIAGTIKSITEITKETLYSCYETFYHPSNMIVFVVGGVGPKQVFQTVRENQAKKTFAPIPSIQRFYPEEPAHVAIPKREIRLSVAMPKCLFGFKEAVNNLDGADLLKRELTTQLLLDILFSASSPLYQKLYNDGLINDSFGTEYTAYPGYGFSIIGGDTPEPDLLVSTIQEELEKTKQEGISQETFLRSQRKKIGNFLRSLNSPEAIANHFTKYHFKNADLFEVLPMLESIQIHNVQTRLKEHFVADQMAISIVRPVKTAEEAV